MVKMANIWPETNIFDADPTPTVDYRDALYEQRPWDPYDLRISDMLETVDLFASFEGEDLVASSTASDNPTTEV